MSKNKQIGLFGFGCVGQGFYDILQASDIGAEVKKIGVIHPGKERPLPEEIFTYDPESILSDPDIDIIIEAITDHESAFYIVKRALEKRVPVVTANKKMVATYLPELLDLQSRFETPLLYEASCCGAIPIVRTLEDYYGTEPLNEVSGVFNGSSNFILTKMREEGMSYDDAVKEAQDLGYAEADPTLDVGGYDSLNKLCILAKQAYGTYIPTDKPFRHGIQNLSAYELTVATQAKTRLKLLAEATVKDNEGLTAFVAPVFVPYGTDLYGVEHEYNAVHVSGHYSANQLYRGKGAGGHPTGSAVFADMVALLQGYGYRYAKARSKQPVKLASETVLDVFLRIPKDAGLELPGQPYFQKASETGKIIVGKTTLEWLKSNEKQLEKTGCFLAIIPEVKDLKDRVISGVEASLAEIL